MALAFDRPRGPIRDSPSPKHRVHSLPPGPRSPARLAPGLGARGRTRTWKEVCIAARSRNAVSGTRKKASVPTASVSPRPQRAERGGSGSVKRWSVPESNRRPPACKANAYGIHGEPRGRNALRCAGFRGYAVNRFPLVPERCLPTSSQSCQRERPGCPGLVSK
jgi:hypothetical protein